MVNCDNLVTLPKKNLGRTVGQLGPAALLQLNQAIIIALGLDQII